MTSTKMHAAGRTLAVFAAAITIAACYDDAPTSPARPATSATRARAGDRAVELGSCGKLDVSDSATLRFHAYARGVQIYRWTGAAWTFVAPRADLFADEGMHGQVATHFGGPTWMSNSGGSVVGTVSDRCTPDASAIPWLLLTAKPDGPGVFHDTRFIQRLATVGGLAPTLPGRVVGDSVEVPYRAEYTFYR